MSKTVSRKTDELNCRKLEYFRLHIPKGPLLYYFIYVSTYTYQPPPVDKRWLEKRMLSIYGSGWGCGWGGRSFFEGFTEANLENFLFKVEPGLCINVIFTKITVWFFFYWVYYENICKVWHFKVLSPYFKKWEVDLTFGGLGRKTRRWYSCPLWSYWCLIFY